MSSVSKLSLRAKRILIASGIAATLGLGGTYTYGDVLLSWNTAGNLGTETSEPSIANDLRIAPASLTFGTGVTPAANGNRFGGNAWWDTGDASPQTLQNAIDGNDYIQFIVTPEAGYSFSLTTFSFIWGRSSTGPSAVTLRSSADSFATDLGSLTGLTDSTTTFSNLTINGITGLTQSTTFRLYGYGTGNTASGGTGGFDTANGATTPNVILNGSTLLVGGPPPATFWDGNGAAAGVGGSGTWSTTSLTFATAADGTGGGAAQSTGALTFGGDPGTVTVDGTVAANAGITFNSNYTLTGGTALNLTAGPGANTLTTATGVTTTIATPLTGTNGLTKAGPGTMILASASGLTGGVSVTEGTLQLDVAGALPAGTVSIGGANATLKSNVAGPATLGALTIGGGGGKLDYGASAVDTPSLAVNGLFTKAGTGDLTVGLITSSATLGGVNIEGGNLIWNASGSSTLNVSVNSTLTGNLVMKAGSALRVNEGATLGGTGEIQLHTTSALISQNSSTASGTIAAPIKLNSGPTPSFTAGDWGTGTTYMPASFSTSISAGNSSATVGTTLNLNSVISGDSDVDISITSGTNGGGTGTTVLGAVNTYTGNTTINSATPGTLNAANGSVKLAVNNALPNTGLIFGTKTNAGAAVLNLNGKNQAVAYLADGGTISTSKFLTINNLTGTTDSTLTVGSAIQPGATKFGGVLADGGGSNKLNLVKTGSNNQSLSGVSTYTGSTTVSQGTLTLAQGGQLGATNVSVAGGATLATAYTAAGPIAGGSSLSLASGASLNLGDGTANTLNFTAGASALSGGTLTFDFLSSTSYDVLALGTATLSGSNTIAFNGTPALALGTYALITGTFNTGNFFTGPASLGGFSLAYNNTGSALELVVSNASGSNPIITAAAANNGAFGNLLVGATATTNVTLSNIGSVAATDIAAVAVPGFTLGIPPTGTTIPAGGATAPGAVTVSVDTSTPGIKSGNLTYTVNPGGVSSTPVIALSAVVGNSTFNSSGNTTEYGNARVLSASASNLNYPAANWSSNTNGLTASSGGPAASASTATILNYNNTSGSTETISMQWRTRTAAEANPNNTNAVLSDIVNLTGMTSGSETALTGTGVFVLQMSYTDAALGSLNEASIATSGELRLGWNDNGVWKTAGLGNVGVGGGTATFVGAVPYDPMNPAHNVLGAYGVDPTGSGGVVWAVLNHNSEFAVIPEPSTMVLGVMAVLGLAGLGLRRRRMKSV